MGEQITDIDWSEKRERRKEAIYYVRKFLLYPKKWEYTDKHIPDLKWTRVKFNKRNTKRIPDDKGLYCFIVVPPKPNNYWKIGYLFYVGRALSTNLRSRYKNYLNERDGKGIGRQKPRVKVQEMLNEYDGYIYFFYAVINNKNNIEKYEENILDTYWPYVNSKIPEAKISEELKHIY